MDADEQISVFPIGELGAVADTVADRPGIAGH